MKDSAACFAIEQPPEEEEPEYIIAPDIVPDQEGRYEAGSGAMGNNTTSTEAPADLRSRVEPVLLLPGPRKPLHRFKVLQTWEGTILEISGDECRAVVRDRTTPENPDEEITFSIEEIPESDRPLALEGAVFYWSIGYDDRLDGQRNRVSSIRVRRIPVWTDKELKAAQREAESLGERIGWK